jgi:hypothetical protein
MFSDLSGARLVERNSDGLHLSTNRPGQLGHGARAFEGAMADPELGRFRRRAVRRVRLRFAALGLQLNERARDIFGLRRDRPLAVRGEVRVDLLSTARQKWPLPDAR